MKKLYYVRTNAYDMLVSVDEDMNCRYLTETEEFPYTLELEKTEELNEALKFLNSVEDDSSWDDDCSYQQIFEDFPVEIIAEIEKEI